jgi:stage IV sporulation protein FB
MRGSFHIARIAGIDVKIHATFLLLLAFYGFLFYGQGGVSAAIHGVILISLVFFCVLLHEFGHAFAARRYGIGTADITLLPIGGLARLERMPDKPSEELVVAIAGPLVNVVIAAVLFPFVQAELNPAVLERFGHSLLTQLFAANIMLILFNLIPAFPMDGGRVLRALLAMKMDYGRATNLAASIGQTLAIFAGLYALFGADKPQPMLVLVAIFVFFGAQNEAAMAQMRSISNGLRVRDAMITRFETLPRSGSLQEAVEAVLNTSQTDFPVIDSDRNVCGVLTRDDLIVALRKSGPDTPVIEVMRADVPSVHEGMLFDRAFRLMQEANTPILPVVDSQGRLIGLFTPENIGEFMLIQSAIDSAPRARRIGPPPLPAQ